jgi:hypothetical protein
MDPVPPGISVLKRVTVFVFMFTRYSVVYLRALRADVPLFPVSLTRKLYRKKIPENAIKMPGVPGNKSGFWTLWTPFPVFPESLTRKLYRKKIPEIVKMVSMVPGSDPEFFSFLSSGIE